MWVLFSEEWEPEKSYLLHNFVWTNLSFEQPKFNLQLEANASG